MRILGATHRRPGLGRRQSAPIASPLVLPIPGGKGEHGEPIGIILAANIVTALALWQITHLPGICRLIMHLTKESNDLPIGDNGAADA